MPVRGPRYVSTYAEYEKLPRGTDVYLAGRTALEKTMSSIFNPHLDSPNSGERRRLHPDGNGWVAACVAGIARVRKIWIKCPGAEGSAAKAGG